MTTAPATREADSKRGRYAGPASRGTAVTIDAIVIVLLYYATIGLGSLVWALVNLRRPTLPTFDSSVWAISFGCWIFLYTWLSWAAVGKTVGKAIMGLRIVTPHGRPIGWVRALRRIMGWLVCLLSLGIGFAWIVVSPTRRGWHDHIGGTCVVYDWNARVGSMFVPARRS